MRWWNGGGLCERGIMVVTCPEASSFSGSLWLASFALRENNVMFLYHTIYRRVFALRHQPRCNEESNHCLRVHIFQGKPFPFALSLILSLSHTGPISSFQLPLCLSLEGAPFFAWPYYVSLKRVVLCSRLGPWFFSSPNSHYLSLFFFSLSLSPFSFRLQFPLPPFVVKLLSNRVSSFFSSSPFLPISSSLHRELTRTCTARTRKHAGVRYHQEKKKMSIKYLRGINVDRSYKYTVTRAFFFLFLNIILLFSRQ